MEEDLRFFKEEMTYIFRATGDGICSNCMEFIPEDSFFFFRIKGMTEKHYCRKCGAEITGIFEDPFSLMPAQLMNRNVEISDEIPEEALHIHECVSLENMKTLRKLLQEYPEFINTRNFFGKTPLMKTSFSLLRFPQF